jgi:hypothetical protein
MSLVSEGAAVLVGNGLSQAAGAGSWGALIAELKQAAGITDEIEQGAFPLVYEQIYLCGRERGAWRREGQLKHRIAAHLSDVQTTPLHQRVMALPVQHVLTTNYDLALEGGVRWAPHRPVPVRESTHSLFRACRAPDGHGPTLWHIHGEAAAPPSILLGHRQYAGTLQQVRDHIHGRLAYKNLRLPFTLGQRLQRDDWSLRSWVDLFFTADLHMVGFGLHPVEHHLWMILGMRRRWQLDHGVTLAGGVTLWTHEGDTHTPWAGLVQAHGVTLKGVAPLPTTGPGWTDLYHRCLDGIDAAVR